MKHRMWIAIIVLVLSSIVGCNVATGDCHLRGSDPGSGDVGAGVGASTGPGNPGESPSGGTLPTSVCNEPVDDAPAPSPGNGSQEGQGGGCPGASGGGGAGGGGDACATPQGTILVKFKPSEFPFLTTMEDNDPTADAGGWQEAKVNLEFTRVIIPYAIVTWYCSFTIGMPLRTEKLGAISKKRAQSMSVKVTESVASTMDFSFEPGYFCSRYIIKVREAFKIQYPELGARVTQP